MARCEKYSSKLDISRSLIRIFVLVYRKENMSIYNLFSRCGVLLIAVLLSHFCAMAQGVWAVGAHIDEASPLDFVVGEYVVEYTAPATMGFLPTMMYASISSERQLCDTLSIQTIFDNELQRATLYLTQEMVDRHSRYYVSSIDGRVYLQGEVYNDTQYIDYACLPHGVYLLQIVVPERIPYVVRWIKK